MGIIVVDGVTMDFFLANLESLGRHKMMDKKFMNY
jgi:hypothetical protein